VNRLFAGFCICALAPHSMAGTAGGPPPTAIFGGSCDASAALSLGGNRLLVVDDESKNPLKIYSLERPSDMPQNMGKLAKLLPNTTDEEADLEALALLGDDVVFIASHNWHAKPEKMEARQLMFAVPYRLLEGGEVKAAKVGVYRTLVDDLLAAPAISGRVLELLTKARTLDAKEPGGLSIEGLAAMEGGRLLIGFRNPLLDDKFALLLPLANPAEVLHHGAKAVFETPIVLDLGGRGIRDIVYVAERNEYLVIAGAASGNGQNSQAYWWSGRRADAPQLVADMDFTNFNPEAVVVLPGHASGNMLFLSDDGKNAAVCSPNTPRFRGRWYTLPLNKS
jgi:hypothetical protein